MNGVEPFACARALARPVPVEPRQRRRLGALPGALGDGGEREAGRRHQRLLRAGDDDVGAPGVGLERHRAEARDRVDDGQRAGLAAHGEKRLEVADDPGRRLRVDEERGPSPPLSRERFPQVVGLRGLAPRVRRAARRRSRTPVAIACQRSPNSPCETASTRSPGESRLTIADSNAPVPDDVKTSTSFSVRNTSRSRSRARPKTSAKSGERWWSTGSASARSTSGGTEVGPGVRSFCGRATASEPSGAKTETPVRATAYRCVANVIACWKVGLFEPRIVRGEDPGREADPLRRRVGAPRGRRRSPGPPRARRRPGRAPPRATRRTSRRRPRRRTAS